MSSDEDYMSESIKRARERYLMSKDLKPIKVPLCSRLQLLISHDHFLEVAATERAKEGLQIRTSFTGHDKAFSTTPLSDLSPILLKQLFLHKVHKGRYLLARIVTRPNRTVATSFVIEDITGSAVSLSIYNDPRVREFRVGDQQLEALYPVSSVIAIREPFLKIAVGGDEKCATATGFIRVDSPSDLVFLPSTSPLLRSISWSTPAKFSYSSADYRALGDEFYKKKDFTVAQFLFTQAIEATPVDSSTKLLPLYRNRSMAALSATNFGTSTRDCKKILEMLELGTPVPKNDPALVENKIKRLANAQYGQRKFTTALSTFHRLAKEFPLNAAGRIGIGRCEKRLEESRNGIYDWQGITSQVSNTRVAEEIRFNVDVGDYFNPDIEIGTMDDRGGGRGIVATREIRAGSLLVVEKSFVSSYFRFDRPCLTNSVNFMTGTVESGTHHDAVTRIVEMVQDDGKNLEMINSLFAGEEFTAPSQAKIPRATDQEVEAEGVATSVDIDFGRIEGVASINCFSLESTEYSDMNQILAIASRSSAASQAILPTSLFITSSIFNHQCSSNAFWGTAGDLMVIRALKKIKVGEEITIQYVGVEEFAKRSASLAKHFDERGCNCILCVDERLDGDVARERRKKAHKTLSDHLDDIIASGPPSLERKKLNLAKFKKLITSLESTYSKERKYRPELFDFYTCFAGDLLSIGITENQILLVKEGIQVESKAFQSIGLTVATINSSMMLSGDFSLRTRSLIRSCISLAAFYRALQDQIATRAWISTAKELERIQSGEREAGYFKKKNLQDLQNYNLDSFV